MLRVMTKDERMTVLQRAQEALAERLRKKRATQRDVAIAAGIAQASVNRWRDGGPSIDVALRFCQAANCCVEWLYLGRGPKRPPPADALGERLFALWMQLPDEQARATVIGFMTGLVRSDGAADHGQRTQNTYEKNPEKTAARVLRMLEK